MKLHVVGGFLGSGKTTAIAAAAQILIERGKRVAVVTNDQGKYLVDTAFLNQLNVPAVEVTGGCFCCNYEDLETRLQELEAAEHPDMIFAESVGSCADIVATVINPLLQLSQQPASFTVFTDSRLLRQRLMGLPMPFADDVNYIFDQQIEEAGLLIINKSDLLAKSDLAETVSLAHQQFPAKTIHTQHSLDSSSVENWLRLLEDNAPQSHRALTDLDYDVYGAGEARLAWLDEELRIEAPSGSGTQIVKALIERMITSLEQQDIAIGHLKFIISDSLQSTKISLPTITDDRWQQDIPALHEPQIIMMINARVQATAEILQAIVAQATQEIIPAHGATFVRTHSDGFHPGMPRPFHRIP